MKEVYFREGEFYLHIVGLNANKTKWNHYAVNKFSEILFYEGNWGIDEDAPEQVVNASPCDYEEFDIKWHTDNKKTVIGEVVGWKDIEFERRLRHKLRIKAKCHPEDTFDFNVGRKIVKERMGFDPDAGDEVDFNPDVPDKETTILLLKHFFLANELHSTWKQKNKAYGDSFSKSVETYGLTAALTRMSDKWNRIENLIMKADVNVGDEPLRDSLMDLANYCLMTVMCIEKDKESAS